MIDFETYSSAGYEGYISLVPKKPGIRLVGAMAYARHPSTEAISLAYDLGQGMKLWTPGQHAPEDLFEYIASGGKISAWNSFFEYVIWKYVCVLKLGWPELPLEQIVDTMAKAAAWSLPLGLDNASKALGTTVTKDTRGKYLIRKLSVPQKPTAKAPLTRLNPLTHPDLFQEFYEYNRTDVLTEDAVSSLCPDLSPYEMRVWQMSERINLRGVAINTRGVKDCIRILKATEVKYLAELKLLTGGAVDSVSKTAKLQKWLSGYGVETDSVDKATVTRLMDTELPDVCRRVLEIRQLLGLSSVKKLYALEAMTTGQGRVHGLFKYGGAPRTLRFAGADIQPHNLPKGTLAKPSEFLTDVQTYSLDQVEDKYKNPITAISGALRTLFVPGPGKEFICSDYSAIEAVVLAEISDEPWRKKVFRTHGKIYEASASKITGVPLAELFQHKKDTGEHHSFRTLGKVAELASGYGGGIGAWVRFGADKFLTDDEIRTNVKAWRAASPNIVNFWYGLEKAAIRAIRYPGKRTHHKCISYYLHTDGVLYCGLPSGRRLSYHKARVVQTVKPWGDTGVEIRYHGWNTDITKGPKGWMETSTWGGKLTENVDQAISRDILVHAMLQCEPAGYPIVLHVHDEIVAEVSKGYGSVEELEDIMCRLPSWAADWPIKAAGGWRGKFYRKD